MRLLSPGSAEQPQTVEAAELIVCSAESPRLILSGAGPQPVVEIKLLTERTEVVEVVFEANAVVLAWALSQRWRARTLSRDT